jgi:hypothetical protein
MSRRQRTVEAQGIKPGRFRPETVQRVSRPRTFATTGEVLLAKQMARAERNRRNDQD